MILAVTLAPETDLGIGAPPILFGTQVACGVERTSLDNFAPHFMDRGYAKFDLFRRIRKIGSSFVCRAPDNSVYEVLKNREFSAAALAVGLRRDDIVRFTGTHAHAHIDGPPRLVAVKCQPYRKTGHTARGGPEQGEEILIATDVMEVPADVIALHYKHRWPIETLFRSFKHVLGCRHLISHRTNGIEIQTYVTIIACLLIALWTGKKPTLRTYEMICFYFSGLADEAELLAHIQKFQPQAA